MIAAVFVHPELPLTEANTLKSVPLFPLGTVLFPGGLLPLSIFEVRYLDMIGQCHRTGAPFGVVTLQSGTEVQRAGAPAESFHAVGTLARITHFDTPQAGLMMVRSTGTQRFRSIASRQLKHGLWVADVELLQDDLPVLVPDDLQIAATTLKRLLQSLHARQVPDDQLPLHPPYQMQDCGWLANRWCELLPLAAPLKQRLMELDNPLVRLELVVDLLSKHQIVDDAAD